MGRGESGHEGRIGRASLPTSPNTVEWTVGRAPNVTKCVQEGPREGSEGESDLRTWVRSSEAASW